MSAPEVLLDVVISTRRASVCIHVFPVAILQEATLLFRSFCLSLLGSYIQMTIFRLDQRNMCNRRLGPALSVFCSTCFV